MAAKKKTEEQVVRVAPLGELRAYTIWEHELEQLEQGAPVSDLLTIGLCLRSWSGRKGTSRTRIPKGTAFW